MNPRTALAAGAGLVVLAASLNAQQPPTPVFKSSVEVTTVDVGVVDNRGLPVMDLSPEDFTVLVDGAARRVVSAEWVSLVTPPRPDAPPAPPGYSSNENSTGGRLIMIVIDQPNIRFGGAVAIRSAVNGFIEHLQPSDRIAVIGLGPGGPPSVPFTTDRRRLLEAVARMVGARLRQSGTSRYTVTLSEAFQIDRQEPGTLDRVITRECAGEPVGPRRDLCIVSVENEALTVVAQSTSDAELTMSSLRALLEAVRHIDAPKTMIFVSEGFVVGDRLLDVQNLGSLAAAARTSIYALRLDETMFSDITDKGPALTRFEDRQEARLGVETLANAARGSLFNITVSADHAFERIESELSGYYILAVESLPADKDGKPHPIRVSAKRPGVSIRSRRQVMTAGDLDHPRTPREAVMSALASPMIVSALPLTVAAFPLQGPDASKIQLLLHAAVGSDYPSSKLVTFGYTITDTKGVIVESLGGDVRLSPLVNGVPSALQYDLASSVPPGEYTLKLAMAEGERVGSVEHRVQAWLTEAPPVRLSELMVGGPPEVRELQRPTIGYVAAFGTVHGYLEAYGSQAGTLKATYEVATGPAAPALVSEEVGGRTAGANRIIFSKVMLVRQLPPGRYVLRAALSSAAGPVKTVSREFELAAAPVLTTSADVTGAAAAVAEVYLPVSAQQLARAFRPEDALSPVTLQSFRERVGPAAQRAFDDGIASMRAREYASAERALKAAIRGDLEGTAPLVYLAAVFAAAGHDVEAASTWQTALADGGDFPQIYQWLGDTLMRTRNLAEARAILEEASRKWPSDLRFAKPLAYLYATFGQGREAVRELSRYLAEHADDLDALGLGIQWTYELHQAGATALTRAEDVQTARQWASAYEKAKGPRTALVRQWMEYLDKTGR